MLALEGVSILSALDMVEPTPAAKALGCMALLFAPLFTASCRGTSTPRDFRHRR